jgi:hypothetical protein
MRAHWEKMVFTGKNLWKCGPTARRLIRASGAAGCARLWQLPTADQGWQAKAFKLRHARNGAPAAARLAAPAYCAGAAAGLAFLRVRSCTGKSGWSALLESLISSPASFTVPAWVMVNPLNET